MGDDQHSQKPSIRNLIPIAWAPGLVKLCRPIPHDHAEGACKSPGKRPLWKRFNSQASTRYAAVEKLVGSARRAELDRLMDEAEAWFEEGYNVGLVPPVGVVVLDCDTAETLCWALDWAEETGAPLQMRGGDKGHVWFRYDPEMLPLAAKQLRFAREEAPDDPPCQLDLRVGGRSQAVVAPSRHLSGIDYAWIVPLPEDPEDVPWLPEALVETLETLTGTRARVEAAMAAPAAPAASAGTLGADGGFTPPPRVVAQAAASEAGHDRLRGYVNRLCRYSSGSDPAAAMATVRVRAEAFARELYGGRPDRLAGILAEGGELQRLIASGWERFGARAPLLEDRTDQGYLDTLLATHGDRWRWAVERATWLEWSESAGHWVQTFDEMLLRAIGGLHAVLLEDALREVDGDRRERLLAMSRQLRNSGKVKSVLARLRAEVAIADAELDRDPWLLHFPGGYIEGLGWIPAQTLDLASGDASSAADGIVARTPSPRDYITRAMGAPWVPDVGEGRLWAPFLRESAPDPDLRAFLQRAAGMTAVGETLAHAFLFLFGPGGTGKSTFLGALFAAFGSYAVRCDFRTFAEDSRRAAAGASPDVARLRGARLAVCSEIPDRTHLGARMKDLTGGDRIVARHLYGREVEFAPSHTVWIAGNTEPSAEFTDTGVWRRMHQLPFDRVHDPARVDPALGLRLTEPRELAAIAAWVVRGWAEYQRAGGLGTCAAVERATAIMREALDPLAEWLDECCAVEPGAQCGSGDAWASFQAWASRRGGRGAGMTRTRFAAILAEHGITTDKGAKGMRVFRGVRMLGIRHTVGVSPSL